MSKTTTLTPIVAVLIATLAYLLYTIGDASAKWLVRDYSSAQILFVMNTIGLAIMSGIAIKLRGFKNAFQTNHSKLHFLRTIFMVANMLLVLYVLEYVALADYYGIVFQSPIWVAILSVFVFKKHVPFKEWLAIIAGFIGVLIIVGPEFANLNKAFLIACLIPILGASAAILARLIGKTEPVTNFAIWFHIAMIITTGVMLLTLPGEFKIPTAPDFALMVLFGAVSSLALMSISLVFSRSHAVSQVAPLQYTQMILGILIGLIVFNEQPTISTMLGGAIVIASGIYVLHCLRRGRLMNR